MKPVYLYYYFNDKVIYELYIKYDDDLIAQIFYDEDIIDIEETIEKFNNDIPVSVHLNDVDYVIVDIEVFDGEDRNYAVVNYYLDEKH